MQKEKVIVILGQTTTGKSALAIRLASQINGEVISADSRQVYKGLDIGSAKITKQEMKGVPHYLLDVADPKKNFTVSQYKKLAEKKIKEIISRGKVPILCGGTGFYIDAVTRGIVFPEVPPNLKLRKSLMKEPVAKLFTTLKKIDPTRSKNIDPKNKVRLVRAIEIAEHLGKVPEVKSTPRQWEFLKIGLKLPEEKLKRKIKLGLKKRIRSGMAVEVYNLNRSGIPWKRFSELGFDQKYIALYLQKKISAQEMLKSLFLGNWKYAKRQMTWFKRDPEIHWFDPSLGTYKDIKKAVASFLKE